MKKLLSLHANTYATIALILALPMGIILPAVALNIESIELVLKKVLTWDGDHPNVLGIILIYGGFLALPFSLFSSLWPMLRKDTDGKRHFYVLHAAIAIAVAILIAYTWGALAEEVYRCEVLQIPNCD